MKTKMTAIFVILMIALMAVGMSYAMWSKELTISGTVNTGTVDAKFTKAKSNDAGALNDPSEVGIWSLSDSTPIWEGRIYDEDVGKTTVSGAGSDTLAVTVTNAYPSYQPGVGFTVDNTGSIPVKVKSIKLTMVSEGGTPYTVDVDLVPGTWYYWKRYEPITTTEPDVWTFAIHVSEMTGKIEVGKDILGDLCIHIGQQAEQFPSTYDFTIKIVVAQWNEP